MAYNYGHFQTITKKRRRRNLIQGRLGGDGTERRAWFRGISGQTSEDRTSGRQVRARKGKDRSRETYFRVEWGGKGTTR